MAAKHKIRKEIDSLFHFRDTNRKWQIPMLTAPCVGLPLVVGLSLDAMGTAVIASLSGMIILYLPNTGSLTNRMSTLLISAFGFMASFALGQLFSFGQLAAVVAFGLFS